MVMEAMAVFYFLCEKPFSTQSSPNRHQREVHNLKCSILTYDPANNKINKFCTSQIILKKNVPTKKCSIRYFYKHYGHEVGVQHVRISKEYRFLMCVENKLNRVDLLVCKDINNINSVYNISISDGCRHKDDATNVHLFVSECSESDLNPVVYYKPQGHYLLDEDEFEKELEKFLKYLNNNNSLAEFQNYFLNSYYPIRTQWAYAYRKLCNINTNMHLESMHRALKYFY
nr:unnamed protein product [Callosobruchus analis]